MVRLLFALSTHEANANLTLCFFFVFFHVWLSLWVTWNSMRRHTFLIRMSVSKHYNLQEYGYSMFLINEWKFAKTTIKTDFSCITLEQNIHMYYKCSKDNFIECEFWLPRWSWTHSLPTRWLLRHLLRSWWSTCWPDWRRWDVRKWTL